MRFNANDIESILHDSRSRAALSKRPYDSFMADEIFAMIVEKLAEPEKGRPIETAPRDGTIIRLCVIFTEHPLEDDNTNPLWTIGANSFDNTGEDKWQFAGWSWDYDCFTEGEGTVLGWLPMASTS